MSSLNLSLLIIAKLKFHNLLKLSIIDHMDIITKESVIDIMVAKELVIIDSLYSYCKIDSPIKQSAIKLVKYNPKSKILAKGLMVQYNYDMNAIEDNCSNNKNLHIIRNLTMILTCQVSPKFSIIFKEVRYFDFIVRAVNFILELELFLA